MASLLLEPGCPPVCIYQDVELVLTRWLLWHHITHILHLSLSRPLSFKFAPAESQVLVAQAL